MTEPSKNPQAGHAAAAYPLCELTRALPPLPAFQALVAAAQLGSISRAAEHLCRTQGAVSRQIQQLEAHYRCALFVRHASGLALTEDGSRLLAVATELLSRLAGDAGQRARVATTLSVVLPSTFAIRWLLPRLPEIEQALGGTELRIATSQHDAPDFTAPDVDAVVVRGKGQWPGMTSIALFDETLAPMCAPALAARLRSAGDLARATLLHPGAGRAEWRCWLDQAVDQAGASEVDARRGLVFDTLELTLAAAQEGHGVAIGDPRMARERLRAGALVQPFEAVARNGLGYCLVYPSPRDGQAKLRAFAQVLERLARAD